MGFQAPDVVRSGHGGCFIIPDYAIAIQSAPTTRVPKKKANSRCRSRFRVICLKKCFFRAIQSAPTTGVPRKQANSRCRSSLRVICLKKCFFRESRLPAKYTKNAKEFYFPARFRVFRVFRGKETLQCIIWDYCSSRPEREADDSLDVVGLREKVKGNDRFDDESPVNEYSQIAGKGRRLAGNV